ncbi:hypothetical protein, partial [Mitsuaria sp. TWR114]|uniref:hypothetical protein n=1 Tax=Mitsuaria sp. TWR114 TaxID=2601731 RepID=UPI00164BDDAF
PVRFVSEAPIAVTDTRLAALCTLRLERDPLIAPERDLHYVTRAKVARPVADGRTVWPLFGAAGGAGAEDARIGLAVASPLLALREGDREIRVILRQTSSGAAPDLRGLRDAALRADSAPAFRDAFGDLLPQWLLADGPAASTSGASGTSATTGTGVGGVEMDVDDLSEADWTALRHTAHRLTGNGLPALFTVPAGLIARWSSTGCCRAPSASA